MEITQHLLNANSGDAGVRRAAEQGLAELRGRSREAYMVALAAELASGEKPADSRMMAGLILKNEVDGKRSAELGREWRAMEAQAREQVKALLLRSLCWEDEGGETAARRRSVAAQAIANVAAIELPAGDGPGLVDALLLLAAGQSRGATSAAAAAAALEALGYVCEEVPGDALPGAHVDAILTALVRGVNAAAESAAAVGLAAARALRPALALARPNFERAAERDCLMRAVCSAAASPADARVRQAAFECLASLASAHYSALAPYIKDIFALTARAIRGDDEAVALQAVEFWSSVCDEEIGFLDAAAAAAADGFFFAPDSPASCHFIRQALPVLVPLLLHTLLKQSEDEDGDGDGDGDDDGWSLAMAGGTCLGLAARAAGDDIVPLVMPFVHDHIAAADDWRRRDAATYALGAILDGPSPAAALAPVAGPALGFLLRALRGDASRRVRGTSAWAVSRMFEFVHAEQRHRVATAASLPHIVPPLLDSLRHDAAASVAEKVCGAIYFLAQGYEGDAASPSSPLSPFFQGIVHALLEAAEREDAAAAAGSRLPAAAYEAMNEAVRCAAADAAPAVAALLPPLMDRLDRALERGSSADERERQGLLCGALQAIVQRLGASDLSAVLASAADRIMGLLLRVLGWSRGSTAALAPAHEEAMLAAAALASALGPGFARYMPELCRFLEESLGEHHEASALAAAAGVVGDLCRALDAAMLPFCDGIVAQLLCGLASPALHSSAKPAILSCLADVVLAVGGDGFARYLQYAMPMIQGAADVAAAQAASVAADHTSFDFTIQLRHAILEAYSGIFQGFKNNSRVDSLVPYTAHILRFLESIYEDKDRDDSVTRAAVGMLGDVADTLGPLALPLFRSSVFYKDFLDECISSDDVQLKETAKWARLTINRITAS